jgi:alpha-N-arabinofuranosidase
MKTRALLLLAISGLLISTIETLMAQAALPVYTNNLVNSFQDWSYNCAVDYANTTPVYAGTYSIAVTNGPGGTVQLHAPNFDTTPYTNLTLWLNGGPAGGQLLRIYGQINGSAQTAWSLPALAANTWREFTVPLATLGVAGNANFNGILIQNAASGSEPVYYVGYIQIGAAPAPATVHINVNATQTVRQADARWFGVNLANWDSYLSNPETLSLLQQAGFQATRLPGGSEADWYHWASNAGENAQFYQNATNLGVNGQAFITVNYGTGTPAEAAAWVLSANITNGCHFKYWEIGNECYGTWEGDEQVVPHDPYTYAVRAAQYMELMRAADPTIKIGVVATPGDASGINNYNHSATNPATGAVVYGWTPVMLATLKSLGARPDFLIHHVYPQFTDTPWASPDPSPDSDPILLQMNNWADDAATLRQEITDYYGTGGTNIELCCTENNSDSSLGGKQLSSLVNGLYLADTLSRLMRTEFNSYLWWDLRNGDDNDGDLDHTVYGWRDYGDEGVITGLNSLNPTYYSMKLMQYFVRPGDTVVNATSDYLLLSAYAARRSDGALNLLVINKDVAANFNGQINLSSFAPGTNILLHSFGIPQDNAAESNLTAQLQDIAVTNYTTAGNLFNYTFPPYSLTLLTFMPTNYLTLAVQMGNGVDWNTITNWSDGQSASVSAAANSSAVYDVLAGAIVRSPASSGATFPGSQLLINGNGTWVSGGAPAIGEFRLKASLATIPSLQMNGGQFDVSVSANSQSAISGQMDILANTPVYNDPANDQGLTVNAFLTGTGSVEWVDQGFALANGNTLNIAGNTNTFTGTWSVNLGTLLGTGTQALGTNSITVSAPGCLETTYDLTSPNASLVLNGRLLLHQNDTFGRATIGGTPLLAGTYTFAQLVTAFPAFFPTSWPLQKGSSIATGSGSLTVLSEQPPVITAQPQPALAQLYPGGTVQFTAAATGGQLACQWQGEVGGSGVYTNLINGGRVSGVTTMTLSLTNVASGNAGNYILVITNYGGAVTSLVANLKLLIPDGSAYQAAMLGSSPAALYELNETGNPALGWTVADDSAGGNNGFYGSAVQNGYNNIAGPRYMPDGLTGFPSGNLAANFTNNTANSQITLPPLNLNTNTVTITTWVKPGAFQNSWAGLVFCRGGTTVAGLSYTGTQSGGNYTLGYNWNNDQNVWSWNSGLVVPTNQWSLVALSVNPSAATIYVLNTNGITSATHTYNHVVQNFDGSTLIGDDSADGGNGARGFHGTIDEVAIFNRTLSASQLNNLFATASVLSASFTSSQTTGFAPMAVTFTDTSTGNITNRHWIFGDGATLATTATSVSHSYNNGGTYPATLVVCGPAGAATNTLALVVTPVPANGLWSVNFCCVNTVNGNPGTSYAGPGIVGSGTYWNPMTGVQSASSATTYRDDGVTGSGGITLTGANVTGNYSGNQPYTLQLLDVYSYFTNAAGATFIFGHLTNGAYNLILYGINGHWDDHQVMFTVNGATQTLTSVQDTHFAPDNTCIYTNVVVANNQMVVKMVGQPTANEPANTEGDFDGAQLQFVSPPAPVANFSGAPTNGFAPLAVTFTDTSSGSITNRHWIFGDGSMQDTTATNVSHTYTMAGTNAVALVASGPGGAGTNLINGYIVATKVIPPLLTGFTLAANNLVMVGSGTPAATYGLWSWTNLALPASGVLVTSGFFDPLTGMCTNQIVIEPTNPALYFRLESPYP